MEKLKTNSIIILIVIIAGLCVFHFVFPKVVTKTETKIEIREVIKYVTSNATVTGATNATILPGGATAVSGANITITATSTITETSTTKSTETIKERYSENNLNLGIAVRGLDQFDIGPSVGGKLSNISFSADYYLIRRDFAFRAGMSIFTW